MDITLVITLLILVLGILFILGLIAPAKFTAWGGSKPHRGKAFFYLIAAFILLLVLGSMADDVLMKKIKETPELVTELALENEDLKSFPDYLPTLINLEEMNLGFNRISHIDENIRGLKSMRWILLDHNPITKVPEWLLDFESLTILSLYNTDIDSSSLPVLEKLMAKGVKVTYDETLITGKSKTEDQLEAKSETDETEDEHAESFAEYAKRRLLEGRGAEHRRKYGKGEIFYESGMEHALLDSLGAALTDLGLFTPEKEVSVELAKKDDQYQLKIVTLYKDKEEITEDIRLSWHLIAIMIKARVFEEKKMEVHLVDQHMELLEIIKPNAN